MSFDPVRTEYVNAQRADRVRQFLQELWGDDMPPSADPLGTLLIDAVAADDLFGSEDEVVVQADGLHYGALAELARRSSGLRLDALLGPRLLTRLSTRLRARASWAPAVANVDLTSGATPYGAAPAGAWELEDATRTLTWDRQAALLVGSGDEGGSGPWAELLERFVHAGDRSQVRDGMTATLDDELPYEVHFRHRSRAGGFSWIRMSGRRISPAGGTGLRVVGMVSE